MDDGLEGVVHELAIDQELEEPRNGRLPFGDYRPFGLLLALLGQVPGVQFHRGAPHLVHEREALGSMPPLRHLGGDSVDRTGAEADEDGRGGGMRRGRGWKAVD